AFALVAGVKPLRDQVVLVHGLWDSPKSLQRLGRGLAQRCQRPCHYATLQPASGRAPIPQLAAQLETQLSAFARIDVVAFSMGALVTRYAITRGQSGARIRRFISISAPHAGSHMASLLPGAGLRDMRPGSALLRDLAAQGEHWGAVEVHTVWTPLDLSILPARSSQLAVARSDRAFWLPLHRLMVWSPSVTQHVAALLQAAPRKQAKEAKQDTPVPEAT
ncbi:MAG: esterase/lipase family protein, partial [Polyangiales bacterium]